MQKHGLSVAAKPRGRRSKISRKDNEKRINKIYSTFGCGKKICVTNSKRGESKKHCLDELKQWKICSACLQLAAEDSEIEKGAFRIEDNGLGQWQEAITYFVKSLFIRKHKIKCEMKPETIMIKVENSLSGNYYRESTTPLPVHDSDEERGCQFYQAIIDLARFVAKKEFQSASA
mmetsp:Transcript_8204/g.11957  ORF Transcript_8204/g.11957 Transcript_8204/m.11957 type:complete len:175 (+) Transcript_8204:540-1064(+)